MFNQSYFISRLPQIHFGSGKLSVINQIVQEQNYKKILLVTGSKSFYGSEAWQSLIHELTSNSVEWWHTTISNEPSPQLVDEAVSKFTEHNIDLVIAIGGGSVMDAGKAIAGLLPFGNSVLDHLEGVGKGIAYSGPATPFIAVPTTAGTGSEATKNAVLSEHGDNGYKKSFRHDTLMPSYAIIDPELLTSCPPELIAANGMDAFTQLLESYVSTGSNPFTDALALSGLTAIKQGFLDAWQNNDESKASEGRAAMAYGALLSGITLAQAGLGSVHGLASPLGAFFPIGHGVVCGSLLAAATEVNLNALKQREPNHVSLKKYAEIGRLLNSDKPLATDEEAHQALIATLNHWTKTFNIPSMSALGIKPEHYAKIVANSRGNSMKTNPIVLTDQEVQSILEMAA